MNLMEKKNYDLTQITRILLEMRDNCVPKDGEAYDDPKRMEKYDAINSAIDLINNPSLLVTGDTSLTAERRWTEGKTMKTPEEIKNSLRICSTWETNCEECPYKTMKKAISCSAEMKRDSLTYIEQLEKRASLNDLRDAIYEDAVAHGLWFERDDCPTTCVEMIQDEVSELDTAAMEWEDDICDNNDDFVEELADVMIMCLSVAGRLEIDIDSAVKRKMEINKARPWKHGKEKEGES